MADLGFWVFILSMIGICYLLVKSEGRHNKKRKNSGSESGGVKAGASGGIKAEARSFQATTSNGEVLDIELKERMVSGDPLGDEYRSLLTILSETRPNKEEFLLFGTKAAILWGGENKDEVEVLCITSFTKGKPVTKKYEWYPFDINEFSWCGMQPRGCSSEIKRKIESLKLREVVA